MYILQMISNSAFPNLQFADSIFSDPIFVSRQQDQIYDQKCACTFFREHAMDFETELEGIQWIQDKFTAGIKIAGMLGVVKK